MYLIYLIKSPIKLVLPSGGGIKGMCHVGVLKALDEQGIKPDILSGVLVLVQW